MRRVVKGDGTARRGWLFVPYSYAPPQLVFVFGRTKKSRNGLTYSAMFSGKEGKRCVVEEKGTAGRDGSLSNIPMHSSKSLWY